MANELRAEEIDILRCLHEDARMSVSDIAERTGMPISTARHRLNRMLEDGMVQVGALIDPLKIGYQIWAIFELRVELRIIDDIVAQLAEEPRLYFIGITTGRYDVWAAGIFKSNDDLLEFVTNRLAHIEGIRETSTASILKLVKRDMPFELASPDELRPRPARADARAQRGDG